MPPKGSREAKDHCKLARLGREQRRGQKRTADAVAALTDFVEERNEMWVTAAPEVLAKVLGAPRPRAGPEPNPPPEARRCPTLGDLKADLAHKH